MTRVLFFTQWFDPEPVPKGLAFARALADEGFDVEVVTGFPNYPGGRVYPGYRVRLLQREHVAGIRITRVPLYPSHDRSIIRRAANYLSFATSVLMYGLFGADPADVIYAYHPPLTVAMAAAMVGVLRHTPVVCDIQDLWPDTLRATGMVSSARVLSAIGRCCDWLYATVDYLVVLSPGFRRSLIARGVSPSRISVVYNWCDENAIASDSGSGPDFEPDTFTVLFAGNLGPAQALDSVMEAAEILARDAPRVRFILLGHGIAAARLRQRAEQLPNVRVLPAVPMSEVGGYLARADALLVHLKDDPLFEITIPSKTQAYMAAGKPIIMAVRGDAADLVRAAQCGVNAQPESPRSIADAVRALVALAPEARVAMGRRGRRYYDEHLSMRTGLAALARVLRRVAGTSVAGRE